MHKKNQENKKSFTDKDYNISQIHKDIDEKIEKNIFKNNDEENIDFESISLRSRDGKKIYYFKNKQKEKLRKFSINIINKILTDEDENPPQNQQEKKPTYKPIFKQKKEIVSSPPEIKFNVENKPEKKKIEQINLNDKDDLTPRVAIHKEENLPNFKERTLSDSKTEEIKLGHETKEETKPAPLEKKPYFEDTPEEDFEEFKFIDKKIEKDTEKKPTKKVIDPYDLKERSLYDSKTERTRDETKQEIKSTSPEKKPYFEDKTEKEDTQQFKFIDEKINEDSETTTQKQEEDLSDLKEKKLLNSEIEEIKLEDETEEISDIETLHRVIDKLIQKDKLEKIQKTSDIKPKKQESEELDQHHNLNKENIQSEENEKAKDYQIKNLFLLKKEPKLRKIDTNNEKQFETKEEIEPSPPKIKLDIKNKPEKEDIQQINLIDKKIEKTPEPEITSQEQDLSELKAKNYFKNHLKNKKLDFTKKPFIDDKKTKDTIKPEAKLKPEDIRYERDFFDESDDFNGWSPDTIERDKKIIKSPLAPKSEVNFEASKDIEIPKEILKIKSVTLSDLGLSKEDWEELDFYPLYEPFSYVEILQDKETLEKRYFLVELGISEEEQKILDFIRDTLNNISFEIDDFESKDDSKYLLNVIDQIIDEYSLKIPEESKTKIFYYLGKSSFGLDKIDPVMKDTNIEDISCDGADIPIFLYHRTYGSLKSNILFDDEDELSSFIYKLAQKCGKHISIAEPMLDATMPDGSRIQMTLSDEITAKGSTFTIRKFKEDPFSPPDLVEYNTMSSEMVAYLWLSFENGINTLFAGGTASGKTTALNAISLFIPRDAKIVSIEETREINLPHSNWIPGVSRSGFGPVISDKISGEIDMYDLMKAALRQRPEYIIVGEIRGREAYVLFQAMATGHATYSTMHADSAQSLIHRLEGKPINIPRVMLQSLDVICLNIITRVKNKRARRCKQIIEVIDIDPSTKEILTNEVFRWDPIEDKFVYSGKSYILERIRAEKDLSREEMTVELKNRQKIVEWMNKNNLREFRQVADIVSKYNDDPGKILDKIEKMEVNNA